MKGCAPEGQVLLGRISDHPKIGIIGLPKVGKTSLIKYLAGTEGIPTQELKRALIIAPDEVFDFLCDLYNPTEMVPLQFEITSTPSLVRGSFAREGNGNAFLSSILGVDVMFHVLRGFEDEEVPHVDKTLDPVRDIETIAEELRIKDRELIDERLTEIDKSLKRVSIKSCEMMYKKDEERSLLVIQAHLDDGNDIRAGVWEDRELQILNKLNLLSSKPIVQMLNMNEEDFKRKKDVFKKSLGPWSRENKDQAITPCTLAPNQSEKSAILEAIMKGFKDAKFICFYTANSKRVKCWHIKDKTKALQAAGVVNPRLEKGFLYAEVIKYKDLKESGSIESVQEAGLQLTVDSTYEVQDKDIISFKSYL